MRIASTHKGENNTMRQTSKLTGESYFPEETIIIVNPTQAAAYLENDAPLLDVYVGRERKICFIFPKNDLTKRLFDKWVKREL